jgi:hypothetical protein
MTAASVRSACSECCLCYTIYYTQRYTWLHATAQARTMHTTTIIATTAAVYCILTATAMYCLHTYYRYASTPWHAPSAVCTGYATTRHATRHGKRNATSGYVRRAKKERETQNRSSSIWPVDVIMYAERLLLGVYITVRARRARMHADTLHVRTLASSRRRAQCQACVWVCLQCRQQQQQSL